MRHILNLFLTITAFTSLTLCAACAVVSKDKPVDATESGLSAVQSADIVPTQEGGLTSEVPVTDAGTASDAEYNIEPSDPAALSLVADSILARMNVRRAIDGLPSIVSHDALQDIATLRSQDMAVRGYLSHQDPNTGHTPAEVMMNSANFTGRLAEVVFVADHSLANLPAVTVAAWLESPANRNVVMDPIYRVGGVGVANGEEGWIVTIVLAERSP